MGNQSKVQINSRALRRYRRGHPWVFRSDLTDIQTPEAGVVTVYSHRAKRLGQAFYSPNSQIALRWLTRGTENFSTSLLKSRIHQAFQLRVSILPDSSTCRMVFGEADGIPSLILDRYGDVWVFQSLSAGLESIKSDLVDTIRQLFSPACLVERNDAGVREKEGLPKIRQILFGNCPSALIREVEGFKFFIDPLEGQKTGFFLDQRFNAKISAPFFHGKLLDCFCHSGQFSMQAARYTDEIVCVDQSKSALEQVEKTAALNEIHKITTHEDNVFDFLQSQHREKKNWDGIILDPPAFVKSRSALEGAIRGYKEINLRALKLLKSGGRLATFSCSQNLGREDFLQILTLAGEDAGRTVKILTEFSQPPDHPRLLAMPESYYLKGYLLQVD